MGRLSRGSVGLGATPCVELLTFDNLANAVAPPIYLPAWVRSKYSVPGAVLAMRS